MNEQVCQAGSGGFIGGMGAVAPMKRSAAAVTAVACKGTCRGAQTMPAGPLAARHDQQMGAGVPGRTAKAKGCAQ